MEVWVIWISNEEQSNIIGVASTKEKAFLRIESIVPNPAQKAETRQNTVEVTIDGYSSVFLVPLEIDSDLEWYEREVYGLENSTD